MFSLPLSKIDASNPQNHYQSTCVIRPVRVVEYGALRRVATGISGVVPVMRVRGEAVENGPF